MNAINEKQKDLIRSLAAALTTPGQFISTFFMTTHKADGITCIPLDNGFSLDTVDGWDKLTVEDVTVFTGIGIFNREQRTSRSGSSFTLDGDFVKLLVANDFQFLGKKHRRFIPQNAAFYADLSQSEHAAIRQLAEAEDCLPVDLVRIALSEYAKKQGKQIELQISQKSRNAQSSSR